MKKHFNIDNKKKCFLSHTRKICEGSCDTEDWSNDAGNSALITIINYILTYIIFDNITVFTIFMIKYMILGEEPSTTDPKRKGLLDKSMQSYTLLLGTIMIWVVMNIF